MENYCVYCGDVLDEGMTSAMHHQFKKMCINCHYSSKNEDGTFTCVNEDNRNAVAKKMIEAASSVTESYRIDNIDIKPLPLKKPTGKCKQWTIDVDVLESLTSLFV